MDGHKLFRTSRFRKITLITLIEPVIDPLAGVDDAKEDQVDGLQGLGHHLLQQSSRSPRTHSLLVHR